MFGRKWMFIAGLVGFAVASAVGGPAQGFGMLVAARAMQGAVRRPARARSAVAADDDVHRPGGARKAFGIFGAIAGSGASVGLLLGGVLTEYLSWRWCLYVNLAVRGARRDRRRAPAAQPGPDGEAPHRHPRRALTASLGLFALVYGFSNAETHGWGARHDGRLARRRRSSCSSASSSSSAASRTRCCRCGSWSTGTRRLLPRVDALVGAAMFGVFLFLTYYLQKTLGFSPVKTGLAFLPMTARSS